jgi:hypothetical protein
MKPIDKTTKRAIADNPTTAEQRRALIAESFAWIQKAIDEGFYVEAVSLIESLAADRLESRLSYLIEYNVGFQNLNTLIEKTYKEEHDEQLKSILKATDSSTEVLDNLSDWNKARNKIIHEIGKMEDQNYVPFHEKRNKAKQVAVAGFALLKKLTSRVTTLRRRKD